MSTSHSGFTRRRALQAVAAPALFQPGSRRANPISEENRRPGTVEWQLKHYRYDNDLTGLRSPRLEGYASDTSVYPARTDRLSGQRRPGPEVHHRHLPDRLLRRQGWPAHAALGTRCQASRSPSP